jgi:hypothetical protein
MSIRTQEFNLTDSEMQALMRIIYLKNLRPQIIVYLKLATLILLLDLLTGRFTRTMYIFLFLGISLGLRFTCKFPQSPLNYQTRFCEINTHFFELHYQDGSSSKTHLSDFASVEKKTIKADQVANYYLLYLMKNAQFHYIPMRAFNSSKDLEEFDLILKQRGLLR